MSDVKRRGPRRLSHAENELWRAVTADVTPFHARPQPLTPAPAPAPADVAGKVAPPRSPAPAAMDRPPPPRPSVTPLADIDHREMTKIRRGRLEVDAKLDLHGMRQAEAQSALIGFLRRAQAQGSKVVIVVTGKGLAREDGGVLRRVVPMWLQAPGLRDLIVGFGEAARHHGGEGALYVRIRRPGRL